MIKTINSQIKYKKKILITGCAGFIGFHLVKHFLKKKNLKVIGVDNVNNYYDIKLKKERLKILFKNNENKNFIFKKISLENKKELKKIIKNYKINIIINLAAQAGVRYSITNPNAYFNSNVLGFYNILDLSRKFNIKHLIFASSSSVYGNSNKLPLKEDQKNTPIQFYAATKICNETMASTYSNIYNIRITGLRFFTVYGPWGRPDMALYLFVKKILQNKPIEIFNFGNHYRDFTFIDDIINGITKVIFEKNVLRQKNKFHIFNLGSGRKTKLSLFIKCIESLLNKKAIIKKKILQQGDVKKTHANINLAKKIFGYQPKTKLRDGILKYIKWYKYFYEKNNTIK